jgi:hypothetical protein
MREKWSLPPEDELLFAGCDWLLRLIGKRNVEDAGRLVLILWRAWFVRNELTHSARKLSIVQSVGFLLN